MKLYVLCTCRRGLTRSAICSASTRGALTWPPSEQPLTIWYLGMPEWAEESECREEEMYGGQRGAGCVVLGIFREHLVHIHEEVRGFILKKKICSDRSSFIFTVYVCKPIVKVLQ